MIRKRDLPHIDVEGKPSFESGIGFQPVILAEPEILRSSHRLEAYATVKTHHTESDVDRKRCDSETQSAAH